MHVCMYHICNTILINQYKYTIIQVPIKLTRNHAPQNLDLTSLSQSPCKQKTIIIGWVLTDIRRARLLVSILNFSINYIVTNCASFNANFDNYHDH